MKLCPVIGCSRPRRGTHVMCKTHWQQVPAELRRAIWHSYRQKERTTEWVRFHRSLIRQALEAAKPAQIEEAPEVE